MVHIAGGDCLYPVTNPIVLSSRKEEARIAASASLCVFSLAKRKYGNRS